MKSRLLIPALLLTLLWLGCRKPEEVPTYYVSQEMLRYCWFPDGSYWIYEEDSTPGWIDSVFVTNTTNEILPDYGLGYKAERYGNGLVLGGKSYSESRIAWESTDGGTVTIMGQERQDIAGPNEDYIFYWDDNGASVLSYSPSTKIMGRYDSLQIRSVDYRDAIDVAIDPAQGAYHSFRSIFVRDIGVVHRSMVDGTDWSLIRYHINQ